MDSGDLEIFFGYEGKHVQYRINLYQFSVFFTSISDILIGYISDIYRIYIGYIDQYIGQYRIYIGYIGYKCDEKSNTANDQKQLLGQC